MHEMGQKRHRFGLMRGADDARTRIPHPPEAERLDLEILISKQPQFETVDSPVKPKVESRMLRAANRQDARKNGSGSGVGGNIERKVELPVGWFDQTLELVMAGFQLLI